MKDAEVVTLWGGKDQRSPYLTRVSLFGGRLKLHVFHRGDVDPDRHDHPADFWTFPLVSYVEFYRDRRGLPCRRVVRAFRLHRRKAEFAHLVLGRWAGVGTKTDDGQIATLTVWGKKRREWGFHVGLNWVHWKNYVKNPIE